MKKILFAACAAAGCICAALFLATDLSVKKVATARDDSGSLSAAVRFTDDDGRPRRPTAAERQALSAAFQADLARLARGKKIPKKSWTAQSGATGAVVGVGHLRFLTLSGDPEGELRFDHSRMDDSGVIPHGSAEQWPEM